MLTPRHIQDPSKVLSFTFLPRWPLLLKRPSRISRRQSQKCRFFAELKGCRNFFFWGGFAFHLFRKASHLKNFSKLAKHPVFFHHWLRFQAAEKAKTADLAQPYQPRAETGSKVSSKFGQKPNLATPFGGMISTCRIGEVSTQN